MDQMNLAVFMKKLYLFAIATLLTATTTYARERGSIPYQNINQLLSIIEEYAESPYTGLIAFVKPEVKEVKVTDIELTVTHADKLIQTINVSQDGSIDFPLLAKDIGDNAELSINQPKGSVSLKFSAGIKPLTKHQVLYRELFGVLKDLETIASELVGIPSWLMPSIVKIEFAFAKAANIQLLKTNSNQIYRSSSEHKIVLKLDDALYVSNAQLAFSSLPTNITFIK